MAKKVHDAVLDGAFGVLIADCDKIAICEGEPLSFGEANTGKGSGGKALANTTMSGADFTTSDGVTSGRRTTVAQKDNLAINADGTADHVALLDTVGSRLLYVTTATAQVLTSGNTLTVNAWDIEIADPT